MFFPQPKHLKTKIKLHEKSPCIGHQRLITDSSNTVSQSATHFVHLWPLSSRRTWNRGSELCSHFAARLHLTHPVTHSALLTHDNSTIIHVHSRASPALHTNIKALLLGITTVLDGMILHITHSTGFLQHIIITMCNRWPCWTCQMQDKRHTRTEASRAEELTKGAISWCLSSQTKVRGDSPSL